MPKSNAIVATADREIESALAQARKFAASDRRVVRVAYERKPDLLTLYLDDGVRVSIPRMSLQGLRDAKPAQLSKVEILGRGTGLHWPLLDVDHYVPGLLNHIFGASRWMAELGRRGGAATSAAKASAARANGKKGGRPRERVA
jgi:Protein of unknown function (DUF2442)